MKAFALTNIGVRRNTNQDYAYVSEQNVGNLPNILIVADGMGGHKAGEVASEQAVNAVLESIKQNESKDKITIIEEAIAKANEKVLNMATSDEKFKGMGTTLVAAFFQKEKVTVVNVGDSRAYLFDEDGVRCLTTDHSLVELMVQRGELTRETAKTFPGKNFITRAVGTEAEVECDLFYQNLSKGDCVLLCSDGLSNLLSDQELLFEVVHGVNKSDCCQRLMNIANYRGAPDNVTVVLVSS